MKCRMPRIAADCPAAPEVIEVGATGVPQDDGVIANPGPRRVRQGAERANGVAAQLRPAITLRADGDMAVKATSGDKRRCRFVV